MVHGAQTAPKTLPADHVTAQMLSPPCRHGTHTLLLEGVQWTISPWAGGQMSQAVQTRPSSENRPGSHVWQTVSVD
jgi:hypothetical protein